jgi:hypothetical protein
MFARTRTVATREVITYAEAYLRRCDVRGENLLTASASFANPIVPSFIA